MAVLKATIRRRFPQREFTVGLIRAAFNLSSLAGIVNEDSIALTCLETCKFIQPLPENRNNILPRPFAVKLM